VSGKGLWYSVHPSLARNFAGLSGLLTEKGAFCSGMSLEIESNDVVRLMLQFLKEHNLTESMKTLQKESGVTLNTVDNVDSFANDIRNGKWDSVLSQTAALKLPGDKLVSYCTSVMK
jgi:hypothetical protein